MDFSGQIILSYLEEDNTQRAYFRVRPLLTEHGALTKEDIDSLPDEGYLRIVPDKNEQHTFKERMRELGALCVIDLLNIPPEAIKIRNNKNYAPQRGENNQFIVYSDAVQGLPQQLLYEVVCAEEGDAARIAQAVTPMCFTRSGGRIFGPVSRATGLAQEGASPLPPDSDGLLAVTLPDGQEKLFYWPRRVRKPVFAPVGQASDGAYTDAAPDIPRAAQEPARKLSGMPLYQTLARRQMTQRAHNPLMDTVDQQMRMTRTEPPGAVLAQGAAPRQVENPMEAFKRSLNALWAMPDMQRQAVSYLLGMTGVQTALNQQLAGRGMDAVTAAMNSQIQDLEAERLSVLVQLDTAKGNMAAIRKEALEQLTGDEQAALGRIRQDIDAARSDLEKVDGARARLLRERDDALAQMKREAESAPIQLAAPIGGWAELSALCDRLQKCLRACGLQCKWDDCVHLLTLLILCPAQIALTAPTPADALCAAQAIAKALGAAYAYDATGNRPVHVQAGGDAPMLVCSHKSSASATPYTLLFIDNRQDAAMADNYRVSPWPTAQLFCQDVWALQDMPACAPVKLSALRDAVLADPITPPEAAIRLLGEMDKLLSDAGAPLPRAVRGAIYRYLSVAAVHMEGGAATAIDYAVCAWIVPHAAMHPIERDTLRPLLGGLPRASHLLTRR